MAVGKGGYGASECGRYVGEYISGKLHAVAGIAGEAHYYLVEGFDLMFFRHKIGLFVCVAKLRKKSDTRNSMCHKKAHSCDVLVAMNPAALKQNIRFLRRGGTVIVDIDSFRPADLRKAQFATDDAFAELGIDENCLLQVPVTQMTRDALADSGLDNKSMLKCRNIFALGLVCWLFDRPLEEAVAHLGSKFAKKPAIFEANKRVLQAGFDYGHNVHASVPTYRIESEVPRPGIYTDINGNTATAWGLIMASEKSGLPLFLGSYPITPATDILHELAKRKDLGVKAVQMEDEIAGVCAAIGASFAGNLAVTSTSGPGLALKSEAIGLAVIAELPLVVIDVP